MITTASLLDRCRTALFTTVSAAALSLTFAAGAHAAPIVITFDADDPIGGLAPGTILSNQYAAVGVTFTPNGFSGSGGPTGNWATNTDMTIVDSTDLGGFELGTPLLVVGNVLRSVAGFGAEDGDASFRATFAGGITSLSATFASIAGDLAASTRLFAYNGTEELAVAIATVSGLDSVTQQTLVVSSSGKPITSVVFTPGDFRDYVVVDNITFELMPEPTSMLLLGLGLAGATIARRRRC